ncbi:hypothetical protein HDV00_007072 [Rhizophlyctis rosea]|nr:hypothetical protein HDV00_007072 [Rhizophlyctis rosea]
MAPHLNSSNSQQPRGMSYVAGSAVAAVSELAIFHPVDTIGKRLMVHRGRISQAAVSSAVSKPTIIDSLRHVLFAQSHGKGFLHAYASLFKGIQYALVYKLGQRVYQFTGQPYVVRYLKDKHGTYFTETFGPRRSNMAVQATAGLLIGIGEIMFLPLDALKVKSQTYTSTSFPNILTAARSARPPSPWMLLFNLKTLRELYRGGTWTATRNSLGCFALFGTSAAVKDIILAPTTSDSSTPIKPVPFYHHLLGSLAGAAAAIAIASPLDVIKVRIQAYPVGQAVSGWVILRELLQKEGPRAFLKGLTPKLFATGPKMAFSYAVAQWMVGFFEKGRSGNAEIVGKGKQKEVVGQTVSGVVSEVISREAVHGVVKDVVSKGKV